MQQTANRNTFWAYTLADELLRAGLRQVVIAPGSRSTPLALAFGSLPGLSIYVHLDERGAAFMALGLALASGEPAAVLCTSGTAAANFLPAVVEASQSHIPLLVLTADRPHALRDSGSNQTIDQVKLYGSFPRWTVEVAPPTAQPTEAGIAYLRSLACRALAAAQGLPPGPVHLNLPYSKPLEPIPAAGDIPAELWDLTHGPAGARPDGAPFVTLGRGRLAPTQSQIQALEQVVRQARRGLIYCGPRCPGGDFPAAALKLAERSGFPIFADALSGLRFDPALAGSRALVLGGYETFLQSQAVRALPPPDLILQFGAVPTSKALADYFEQHKTAHSAVPCRRIQIEAGGEWADDTFHTNDYLWSDPALTCRELAERLAAPASPSLPPLPHAGEGPGVRALDSAWVAALERAEQFTWQAIAAACQESFFEGGVLAGLPELLAPGEDLFVGSSLPVRHLDQFARPRPLGIRLFSNRGASGIDGTIASAVGAVNGGLTPGPPGREYSTPQMWGGEKDIHDLSRSAGTEYGMTLVLGDLAFLHDLNSLLAVRHYGARLTIVVINNDGGGIFQRLPVADFEPLYTQLFRTPHGLHFESAARLFELTYAHVDSYASLRQAFQASPRPAIIEVVGDAAGNERVRQAILKSLEQNL